MGHGLRFRDIATMPDGVRQAAERAIARDAAMSAAGPSQRKREPRSTPAAQPPFHSVDYVIGASETVIRVQLAMRSARGLNNRGHWSIAAKRVKAEKGAAAAATTNALRLSGARVQSATVTLTRLAPGNGLDDDNLAGSMKAFRDGVAAAVGIDDADNRVQYRYAQERVGRSGWGVRIEMRCTTMERV